MTAIVTVSRTLSKISIVSQSMNAIDGVPGSDASPTRGSNVFTASYATYPTAPPCSDGSSFAGS